RGCGRSGCRTHAGADSPQGSGQLQGIPADLCGQGRVRRNPLYRGDLRWPGIPGHAQLLPANYDGEPCTQVVIRPETASAEFEEKLKAMASHDLVAGLFNRSWFQEQLDRVSQQAVNSSQP